MAKELSRRDILRGSAAAVVGMATLPSISAASETEARVVKGRPRVGIIGCGGKGTSGTEQAAEHGDIVALCDVDAKERAKALLEHPSATTFDDYRQMFEAMRGKLDAVVISTPDHHHAPATALAIKQGIHCYTEKPLARTIWEARQLARLAREKKVATQMGNQSTAHTPMRKVAVAIAGGAFGEVREVHLWTDRAGGWWKQGIPRPAPAKAPKHLDFDLWLGPRPPRPFGEGYHPFSWRGWWDFGTGSLGDMGCHIFNMPHMALDLRDPVAVQAQTSGHDRDSFPVWSIVTYEFPARNGHPPFKLTWYDGGKHADPKLAEGFTLGENGVIVVCEKGTIFSPNSDNSEFHLVGGAALPDPKVEESPGHMAEFMGAVKGGKAARSNFPDYSGPLTETVLLGNLAIWADGLRLEWDAKRLQVKGTNEFDELIQPRFRPGWSV